MLLIAYQFGKVSIGVNNDTLLGSWRSRGTERTPDYVGRRVLRIQIREYSEHIQREPVCLTFYLQGGGGLGKTRFLQDYVALADVAATSIRVCRVIDLSNPEKRKPI